MFYGFSGAITNMNKYKNKLKLYCIWRYVLWWFIWKKRVFQAIY